MKYRALLSGFCLMAVVLITSETILASGNHNNTVARVRTVPKETKDQKEKKKTEQKAVTSKQLTTSTASLITPMNYGEKIPVRPCSQSLSNVAESVLAQNAPK